MTLRDVIHKVELVASVQPSVAMIVRNDIYRLNACPAARYGAFAWTQGQHSGSVESGEMRYALTLFYVDRLTADRSNELEVQSCGVQTIDNVLRRLADLGLGVEGYTLQPFNQRFTDECAGVFTNVTLAAPINGVCADKFGDFNEDFNEDFLIY